MKYNLEMIWKNKYILIVVLMLFASTTNAQVGFIWDLLTGDFSNAVVDGLDYAGDKYWENVSENAKQLMEIEIDTSKLSAIDYKYGRTNPAWAYNTIVSSLSDDVNTFYENYSVKSISEMGNGKIARHIDNSIRLSKAKYADYTVLSDQTMHLLDDKYSDIKTFVNDETKRDPTFGMLINLSPQKYLDYYKRTSGTHLKNKKNWMCYLSDTFDKLPDRWPENKVFKYKNKDLFFDQTEGFSSIKDMYGNILLTISNITTNKVRLHDLSLLNHQMIPLCEISYAYNGTNCVYTSDRIGRIKSISANFLKKGKNKTKTEITKKDLALSGKKLLYVVPQKYMGPLCIANVYPMQNTKENKKASKALNKEIAKMDNPYIFANIEYIDVSNIISKIVIRCNGNTYEFNL
jgi:hypothetical protein